MMNVVMALSVLLGLLFILDLGVIWGRRVGQKHIAETTSHKLEVVTVAEGAVFALLGLLIAFTFSGAYERFELRKTHIVEEVNAYTQAFQRVDALDPKIQPILHKDILDYIKVHYQLYVDIPSFSKVANDVKQIDLLEKKIWKAGMLACDESKKAGMHLFVLTAFNNMFETAFTGVEITKIHPPLAIFALLIGLAVLGAFLTGYSTASGRRRYSLHALSYVLLTAVTIYLIIDLEMPRVGLIRVTEFDNVLVTLMDNLDSSR